LSNSNQNNSQDIVSKGGSFASYQQYSNQDHPKSKQSFDLLPTIPGTGGKPNQAPGGSTSINANYSQNESSRTVYATIGSLYATMLKDLNDSYYSEIMGIGFTRTTNFGNSSPESNNNNNNNNLSTLPGTGGKPRKRCGGNCEEKN